jgi:hypothetical protein
MSQWQFAGSAPENYEQYLVPAIFGLWAADLISRRRLNQTNGYSMWPVEQGLLRASRPNA